MSESSTNHLVGVAIPTLRELRTAVLASADTDSAVAALREAGFAGGASVHAAFEQWLVEASQSEGDTSTTDSSELTVGEFAERVTAFFNAAGWGDVTFTDDEAEGVAVVDVSHCWEGAAPQGSIAEGCHVTTGMLASFFGLIAGFPVAVLETECCAGDEASRCRFLVGNADVMTYKWEEMRQTALA